METLRAMHVFVNTPNGGAIFLVALMFFFVVVVAVCLKFRKKT